MERSQLRRWLWALGPVALYAGAIVLLSAQSELPSVGWLWKLRYLYSQSPLGGLFGFDKIQHFLEYAVFGFLIARAVQILSDPKRRSVRIWLVATLLGAAFGATDELHQYFVPHRDSSVGDLVADTLGTAFGAASWLTLRSLFRERSIGKTSDKTPEKIRATDDPTLPV